MKIELLAKVLKVPPLTEQDKEEALKIAKESTQFYPTEYVLEDMLTERVLKRIEELVEISERKLTKKDIIKVIEDYQIYQNDISVNIMRMADSTNDEKLQKVCKEVYNKSVKEYEDWLNDEV